IIRIRERRICKRRLTLVDLGHALPLRNWRASQENRVDEGERGSVRADAERQRDDCDRGECRTFADATYCNTQVGDDGAHTSSMEVTEPVREVRVAGFLARPPDPHTGLLLTGSCRLESMN